MPLPVVTNPSVSDTDLLTAFDSLGHLPLGIHPCSLPTLAGIVRFNEHRRKMWLQLSSFLIQPVTKHKFSAAYIGGGFISTKPFPGDIDLVLETSSPYGPEAFESVAPFFVTGLDKIETIYGVHLQFWMRNAPSGLTDYLTFFQYDRPTSYTHVLNRSRGIVRIDLTEPETLSRLRRYIRGENTTSVPFPGGRVPLTPADKIDSLPGTKRQLGLMGLNTSKLVIISDAEGRIEWVNESFIRSCGYSFEEARGQKPGKLLQGPASNREAICELRRAVAEARECTCQIVNYRKSGAPYAVRILLSPILESGKLAGFLAIEEDLGEPANADAMTNEQRLKSTRY
jgi:PAS domain S-box-containing protein